MFLFFSPSVLKHVRAYNDSHIYGLLSLYVHVRYPACCRNYSFSCRLYVFTFRMHTCLYLCVPPQLSVYPALQLAVCDPLCFQPGVRVHVCLYLYICVLENQTDRTLLWAPCCHWGKPIMAHARVSGTPPTNIIPTHSFPLICMDATAKCRLLCFLLPSGDEAKCFLLSLFWNWTLALISFSLVYQFLLYFCLMENLTGWHEARLKVGWLRSGLDYFRLNKL